MKALETPRLFLRGFTEADADDVFEYARDPMVGPGAGWKPHETREDSLRVIRMFMGQGEVWAIVDKGTGKVIGSLGLHRDGKRDYARSRMLGYSLSQAYWGQGLAAEASQAAIRYAFEEMEVDIIGVIHFPFNAQSRRVIEKCGFRYEGTIRLATPVYDGSVFDDVCYSLTRAEWMEGPAEAR